MRASRLERPRSSNRRGGYPKQEHNFFSNRGGGVQTLEEKHGSSQMRGGNTKLEQRPGSSQGRDGNIQQEQKPGSSQGRDGNIQLEQKPGSSQGRDGNIQQEQKPGNIQQEHNFFAKSGAPEAMKEKIDPSSSSELEERDLRRMELEVEKTRVEQFCLLLGGSVSNDEKTTLLSGCPSSNQQEAFADISFGLYNLGNTCYMNAVMQGLYACESFRSSILEELKKIHMEAGSVCTLSLEIARLFQRLHTKVRDPTELFDAICKIDGCAHFADKSQQQDCCELLNKILDQLSETNKSTLNLFEGGTKNTVGCFICEDSRDLWESFTTISLNISGTPSLEYLLRQRLTDEDLLNGGGGGGG